MTTRFFKVLAATLLAASAFAQNSAYPPTYTHIVGGRVMASEYGKWTVHSINTVAAGAATMTLDNCFVNVASEGIKPHTDRPPELQQQIDDARHQLAEIARMESNPHLRGVPDAPFKKDWHELAMKRMLRAAAEGGYDKLGWTTGAQQTARYPEALRQVVDRISWSKNTVTATKNGGGVVGLTFDTNGVITKGTPSQAVGKTIEEVFGKGMAEKILSEPSGKIEGRDFTVGGEGMKGFYDKMIPDFLNKYGKKWGVKVGETTLAPSYSYGKPIVRHVAADSVAHANQWEVQHYTQDGRQHLDYFHYEDGARAFARDRMSEGDKVHSIDVTDAMKKSVLSEGQPLFKPAFGPVQPITAAKIAVEVRKPGQGLPNYLRLNGAAMSALQSVVGQSFRGVNFGLDNATRHAQALEQQANRLAQQGHTDAAKGILRLTDAMQENADAHDGLVVVAEHSTPAEEARVIREELMHAAAQRRQGKGDVAEGVPWRQVMHQRGFRKVGNQVTKELQAAGLKQEPEVIAAEAVINIVGGEHSLEPEEVAASVKAYFTAAPEAAATDTLKVFDYVDNLAAGQGIISKGEHFDDDVTSTARATIEGVVAERHARGRDGEITASGQTTKERRDVKGSQPPGPKTDNLSAGTITRSNATAQETLPARKSDDAFSTQPVGLTDDELDEWSKSKGFRYEPAGEQLGMFGDNDALLRVFRNGPRGREERGLIYQSQLDKLQPAKPENTEPFALTGGETREEQPRLFGAGDLGEIIGTPQAAKPTLPSKDSGEPSLFRSEEGSLKPGELAKTVAEAAGVVGDYLRNASDLTHKARDLQRGLETLDTQKQADILRGVQVMKNLKSAGMTKADDEAIYHHLENPESEHLTATQDKWFDDTIIPLLNKNEDLYTELTKGGVPLENYVHRVVKGKGGMLDRIVQGAKAVSARGNLSKSAPQAKHRTYMALEKAGGGQTRLGEDSPAPGTRRVVSIKGGQVTAWDNGTPENLGGLSSTEEGKAFEDKDGNHWTLKQATSKEIERHTATEYYHSALASTVASNIQLNSAVRAMRFLEAFKGSPEFKEIAFEQSKGTPPDGWQTTNLVQFKGYSFEPRTAEVLDWYNDRMQQGNIGALDQISHFLRVAMLLNPIMHPMNVAASWAMEKGATGFLMPTGYKMAWRAGNKAVRAVLSRNKDFLDALDAGAPLQSHREAVRDITKLFFDQLGEGLGKEEPWAMKMAKALGIEHGNLLNILHKVSSKAAWLSSDIFFLQSAYEHQLKTPGMSLADALKETGRIIPEYRVPTRILDSPTLSKLMTNRWATIFGSYHYSLVKSFAEVAKSALGAQEPGPGRTKAQEVGKGWDRLALLALVTMALYPALDELAKKVTGNKEARFRRSGPFGLIDAVSQVVHHEQSVSTAAQRVVTPAPQTKAAAELAFNREFYAGHQIYDPHADFRTQTAQIGRYLLGELGQVGQVEKAKTTEQKHRFLLQQVGIGFKKTAAEKIAADIAMSKVGTQAESPEDEDSRVLRREILNELRNGNRKPLQEAEAKREITAKQARTLEHRARLTPLQDQVHGFTYGEAKKVYDAATPEERKDLERIMHEKRANLLKNGRGRELTNSTP